MIVLMGKYFMQNFNKKNEKKNQVLLNRIYLYTLSCNPLIQQINEKFTFSAISYQQILTGWKIETNHDCILVSTAFEFNMRGRWKGLDSVHFPQSVHSECWSLKYLFWKVDWTRNLFQHLLVYIDFFCFQ